MRRSAINVRRRAMEKRPPKQHDFSCLNSNSLQIANCTEGKFCQILQIYYFEKEEGRTAFVFRESVLKDITFGLVRMYVTPYRFSWTIFILGLALSYTDKLLVF